MVQAIQLVKGTSTYKIYKFIVKKRAVTSLDINEEFDIPRHHVSSYIRELCKKGLVLKSSRRVQSKTRRESSLFVFGISDIDIEKKIHELESEIDEKAFLVGIKKKIFDVVTSSDKGLTLAEVIYRLRDFDGLENYEGWDYTGNTLRELFQDRLIKRSKFRIPANQMIHGKKPGFIYGRDDRAVYGKIVDMMPREVRKAFLEIVQSNEIFPIDILQRRFGIEDGVIKSWFVVRLISVGWVKRYSYKQRAYFHNPTLPEEYIAERVPKIHEEEVTNAILENSTLGNAFEKQAIFYYVMYLITARGRQIRLNKDFPKKIPSWFNRDDIRNPDYVVLDKNGDPTGKVKVDVWRFDAEPFDYFIFTYDPHLETPAESYVVSIKRDRNRKYLGVAGKRYIAAMWGCISMGNSLDFKRLPKRTPMPVLIIHNVNSDKTFKWADKMNCDVFYKSRFAKLKKYVNSLGIEYSDDKVLEEMAEEFKLLERYRNHEEVILGRTTPEQLVRMNNGI